MLHAIISILGPDKPDYVKIFYLQGKNIKKLKNSNVRIFFVESYYDNKNIKNYIIIGCKSYIRTYDYEKIGIFHIYNEEKQQYHASVIINNDKEMTEMIDIGDH